MAKRNTKQKRTQTDSSKQRGAESITGFSLEETVFERRLEVARLYLRLLSVVEPLDREAWNRRHNDASKQVDGGKKVIREMVTQLESRRQLSKSIRSFVRDHWAILGPLESEILADHGELKRLERGGAEGYPTYRGFEPGPQQHQKNPSRRPQTVLRAPAHCRLLCSTCVEAAILALGRILQNLRSLVSDFDENASARSQILTQSGALRELPRKILDALVDPVDTLEALATFVGVGPDSVRKVTAAMKQYGLIKGDAHRDWARTTLGEQLLTTPTEAWGAQSPHIRPTDGDSRSGQPRPAWNARSRPRNRSSTKS